MALVADLLICLRFFSRLPILATSRERDLGAAGLAQSAAMVPVAGALIAVLPALVLLICTLIGLAPLLAAPLAIAALVAITGALHEDGLADCADGFGGGQTRDRKLEIMRDSHIGTYGVCAIALSLYLRTSALCVLTMDSPLLACAALAVAASLSRTASLFPLMLLPPARADGLGHAAGRPPVMRFWLAASAAALVALLTISFGASIWRIVVCLALAALAGLAVSALAWRQIGGQTGDVAGATQQVAEIAVLLGFAAGAS